MITLTVISAMMVGLMSGFLMGVVVGIDWSRKP